MPLTPTDFFKTKRSLSEIKAELLPAYFRAWAETAVSPELVFADLNAGPGQEPTGEKTLFLELLQDFRETETAKEDDGRSLRTFFGDPAKSNLEKLKQCLEIPEEEGARLPKNTALLNEPESRETLTNLLQKVPVLVYAEPFSSQTAQEIVLDALAGPVTTLFLLFDFKKLEKAFLAGNDSVFISQLFKGDLPEIQAKYQSEKSAPRREKLLLESFESSLGAQGFQTLTFKINAPGKTASGAYLLLASRSGRLYFEAKELLQSYSDLQEDGVALFGANLNYQPAAIPGFSNFLNRYSLQHLTQELAQSKTHYHYQTIREVYEHHSPGTAYVLKNYLTAFRDLQASQTVNLVDANNKKVLKITPDAVVFYRLHTAARPTRK